MIRRAEERDIQAVLRLLVQVNMVHHNIRPDLFNGPATKYTAEQLAEIFRDDSRPVFVCTDDDSGEVLGYAFCVLNRAVNDNILTDIKNLYIDDICVDAARRGGGIGKRLFDHAESYAKSIGCHNVTLNVWNKNDAAYEFYKNKCGMDIQRYTMEKLL